jgi:hypothetical protein
VAEEPTVSSTWSKTGHDLKLRLKKLTRAKRAFLGRDHKVWNPDMGVFEAVQLRRDEAQYDLEAVTTLPKPWQKQRQIERLWILSLLTHHLKTGDRFRAVKEALVACGLTLETATIAQRVRRFLAFVPDTFARRKYLYRVLLSHFNPPSRIKWLADHPGERVAPVTLMDARIRKNLDTGKVTVVDSGVWVFAEMEKQEIAMLKELLKSKLKKRP